MTDVPDFLISRDAAGRERYSHPTMPFESRVAEGEMTQATIQDLQFFNFLSAAQLAGAAAGLDSYESVENDPPDLRVKLAGQSRLAVELTTLSIADVSRQRLSEVRKITRSVQERLSEDPAKYQHLEGRRVSITENASDTTRPPRLTRQAMEALVNDFAEELGRDFGTVQGYPTNPDGTPSANVPKDVIRRGHTVIRDYRIDVLPTRPGDAPSVIANIQAEVYLDDLKDKLISTINEKDIPANEILLISTGLVDKLGYLVLADRAVYGLVLRLIQRGLVLAPQHLNQVILHHWGSADATALFERSGTATLIDFSRWHASPVPYPQQLHSGATPIARTPLHRRLCRLASKLVRRPERR